MRDSGGRAFGRWITQKDLNPVLTASTCEDKFQFFIRELKKGIDCYLPQRKSRSTKQIVHGRQTNLRYRLENDKLHFGGTGKIRPYINTGGIKFRERLNPPNRIIIHIKLQN